MYAAGMMNETDRIFFLLWWKFCHDTLPTIKILILGQMSGPTRTTHLKAFEWANTPKSISPTSIYTAKLDIWSNSLKNHIFNMEQFTKLLEKILKKFACVFLLISWSFPFATDKWQISWKKGKSSISKLQSDWLKVKTSPVGNFKIHVFYIDLAIEIDKVYVIKSLKEM